MSVMQGLRAYHAALGLLVIAAFLTGEAGTIHVVLGYAVAVILGGRVLAAFSGVRPLGLSRFYPQFEGLKLDNAFTHPAISKTLLAGIAATLILATASGIALDRGRANGPVAVVAGTTAQSSVETRRGEREHDRGGENEGGALGHLHEGVSNALMLLVALHVCYLLLFKRPLARFMLFLGAPATPVAKPVPEAR